MRKLSVLKVIAVTLIVTFSWQTLVSANPDLFIHKAAASSDTLATQQWGWNGTMDVMEEWQVFAELGQTVFERLEKVRDTRLSEFTEDLPAIIDSLGFIPAEIKNKIDYKHIDIADGKLKIGYHTGSGLKTIVLSRVEKGTSPIIVSEGGIQIVDILVEFDGPSKLDQSPEEPVEKQPKSDLEDGKDDVTISSEGEIAIHEGEKRFKGWLGRFLNRTLGAKFRNWNLKREPGVNDVIRNYWRRNENGKRRKLFRKKKQEIIREEITNTAAIRACLNNIPSGRDIAERLRSKEYRIFTYDIGRKEFVKGVTTHAGIRTGNIHITKEEYDRLSGLETVHLAARIAHEISEVESWREKADELIILRGPETGGLEDLGTVRSKYGKNWENGIRKWIKENCSEDLNGPAQVLDRQFHRKAFEKEVSILVDNILATEEREFKEDYSALVARKLSRDFLRGEYDDLVENPVEATRGKEKYQDQTHVFDLIVDSLRHFNNIKDREFFLSVLHAKATIDFIFSISDDEQQIDYIKEAARDIKFIDSVTLSDMENWLEESEDDSIKETRKLLLEKNSSSEWDADYSRDPDDILISASSSGRNEEKTLKVNEGEEEQEDGSGSAASSGSKGSRNRPRTEEEETNIRLMKFGGPGVANNIIDQKVAVQKQILSADEILRRLDKYDNWNLQNIKRRESITKRPSGHPREMTTRFGGEAYILPDIAVYKEKIARASEITNYIIEDILKKPMSVRIFVGSPTGYFDMKDESSNLAHDLEITIVGDGSREPSVRSYPQEAVSKILEIFPNVKNVNIAAVGLNDIRKAFNTDDMENPSEHGEKLRNLFVKLYREDIQIAGSELIQSKQNFVYQPERGRPINKFEVFENTYIAHLVARRKLIKKNLEKLEVLKEEFRKQLSEVNKEIDDFAAQISACMRKVDAVEERERELVQEETAYQDLVKEIMESQARGEEPSTGLRKEWFNSQRSAQPRKSELAGLKEAIKAENQKIENLRNSRIDAIERKEKLLAPAGIEVNTQTDHMVSRMQDYIINQIRKNKLEDALLRKRIEEAQFGHKLVKGILIKDKYLIQDKLGEGGYGAVYRVKDLEKNKEMALKIVLSHHMSDETREDTMREFREEKQILRMLSAEKGPVSYLEAEGEYAGSEYFIMGLEKGLTLREVYNGLMDGSIPPLSEKEMLTLFHAVAKTVSHFHSTQMPYNGLMRKVIHRDIKPDNIMIPTDASGRLVIPSIDSDDYDPFLSQLTIIDLGLARLARRTGEEKKAPVIEVIEKETDSEALDEGEQEYDLPEDILKLAEDYLKGKTADPKGVKTFITLVTEKGGKIKGTPHYMSPEQFSPSEDNPVEAPGDVYALGVTFYYLLSGSTPRFDGVREVEVIFYEMLEEIRRRSELKKAGKRISVKQSKNELDKWLCDIIDKRNKDLLERKKKNPIVGKRTRDYINSIRKGLYVALLKETHKNKRLFIVSEEDGKKVIKWSPKVYEKNGLKKLFRHYDLTDEEKEKIERIAIPRIPQVDRRIEGLIHNMLRFEQTERPSAGKVARELEKYLTDNIEGMDPAYRGRTKIRTWQEALGAWIARRLAFFMTLVFITLSAIVLYFYYKSINLAIRESEAVQKMKAAESRVERLNNEREAIVESLDILKKEAGSVAEKKASLAEQVKNLQEEAKKATGLEEKTKELEQRIEKLSVQEKEKEKERKEKEAELKKIEEELGKLRKELEEYRASMEGIFTDAAKKASEFEAEEAINIVIGGIDWWGLDESKLPQFALGFDKVSEKMLDNGQLDEAVKLERKKIDWLTSITGWRMTGEKKLPFLQEKIKSQINVINILKAKGDYIEAENFAESLMQNKEYTTSKEWMELVKIALIETFIEDAASEKSEKVKLEKLAKAEALLKDIKAEDRINLYSGNIYLLRLDFKAASDYYKLQHEYWAKLASEQGIAPEVKMQYKRKAALSLLSCAASYKEQALAFKEENNPEGAKSACESAKDLLNAISKEYIEQREMNVLVLFLQGEIASIQDEAGKAKEFYTRAKTHAENNAQKVLLSIIKEKLGEKASLENLSDTWKLIISGKDTLPIIYVPKRNIILKIMTEETHKSVQEAKRKALEEKQKEEERKKLEAEEALIRSEALEGVATVKQAEERLIQINSAIEILKKNLETMEKGDEKDKVSKQLEIAEKKKKILEEEKKILEKEEARFQMEEKLKEEVLKEVKTSKDAAVKLVQVNKEISSLKGNLLSAKDKGERSRIETQLEKAEKRKKILQDEKTRLEIIEKEKEFKEEVLKDVKTSQEAEAKIVEVNKRIGELQGKLSTIEDEAEKTTVEREKEEKEKEKKILEDEKKRLEEKEKEEKRKQEEEYKKEVLEDIEKSSDAEARIIEVDKKIAELKDKVEESEKLEELKKRKNILEEEKKRLEEKEAKAKEDNKPKAAQEENLKEKKEKTEPENGTEEPKKDSSMLPFEEKPIASNVSQAPDHRLLNCVIKCLFDEMRYATIRNIDAEVYVFGDDTCRNFKDAFDLLEDKEAVKEMFERECRFSGVPKERIPVLYAAGLEKLANISGHAGVERSAIYGVMGFSNLKMLIDHEIEEMKAHQHVAAIMSGHNGEWESVPSYERRSVIEAFRSWEGYNMFATDIHEHANKKFPVSGDEELIPDNAIDINAAYYEAPIAATVVKTILKAKPNIKEEILASLGSAISKISKALEAELSTVKADFPKTYSSEETGNGVIIFADDLVDSSAVFDMDKLAKIIGKEGSVLDKVVLYARDLRKAELVEKIIKEANKEAEVVLISKEEIQGRYKDEYYMPPQIEQIIRYSMSSERRIFKKPSQILGVIRGPLNEDEAEGALQDEIDKSSLRVPVVVFENSASGNIYSIMEALAKLVTRGRISKDGWLFMLPPITRISISIQREYDLYKLSLKALEASA